MINKIKKIIGITDHLKKEDIDRLLMLSPDERKPVLFSTLYEIAFQNAAIFVRDELSRPESLFSGLEKNSFFHEILIMNFWMMQKVFSKYHQDLAEKMHFHYFGTLSDFSDRAVTLAAKIKKYNLCWDEYTGHHDEFGLTVGETLFGKESGYPERPVSFWVISYTDDSIKRYKKIKKILIEKQII